MNPFRCIIREELVTANIKPNHQEFQLREGLS